MFCKVVVVINQMRPTNKPKKYKSIFKFPLFKMYLKDSTPCPKVITDLTNLKYPSRNSREDISSFLLTVLIKGVMREKSRPEVRCT